MHGIKGILVACIISALLASGVMYATLRFSPPNDDAPSREELIAAFYQTQEAVFVDPHEIRKALDTGGEDFILVDLRSKEEYAEEHIVSARSIPAYANPDTLSMSDRDALVSAFRELSMQNPSKTIVVYCHSMPCLTGRSIGNMLAFEGIYVKQLGIGWNEWRYFWTLWNHKHEWSNTFSEDYIFRGEEPGIPVRKDLSQ